MAGQSAVGGCWLRDGDTTAPPSGLHRDCRIGLNSGTDVRVERCREAPLPSVTLQVDAQWALNTVTAAWRPQAEAVDLLVSADGTLWRLWVRLRPGSTDAVTLPPVWTRAVRVRAVHEPNATQPETVLLVSPDGTVRDGGMRRRAVNLPDEKALVDSWPGTVAGLTELSFDYERPRLAAPTIEDDLPGGVSWKIVLALALITLMAVASTRERRGLRRTLALSAIGVHAGFTAIVLGCLLLTVMPIVGFGFLALAGALALVGLCGAPVAALGVAYLWRTNGPPKAATLLFIAAVTAQVAVRALFLAVDASTPTLSPSDVAKLARPAPPSASPEQVVNAAVLSLEASATAPSACTLLAERTHSCRPVRPSESNGATWLVYQDRTLALVQYGGTARTPRIAALSLEADGWGLVALPPRGLPSCLAGALRTGSRPRCQP